MVYADVRLPDGIRIAVSAVNDSVFRIVCTRRDAFLHAPSLVTVPQDAYESASLREEGGCLILSTPACSAALDPASGRIVYRRGGKVLLSEGGCLSRTLEEIPICRYRYDADTTVETRRTVDGEKTVARDGERYEDRRGYRARIFPELTEDEALYGLGSYEEGVGNLRGKTRYMYQQNMRIVQPMLVSTRGWAILLDAGCPMIFRDDESGTYLFLETVDELVYYVILEDDPRGAIAAYRRLTGETPLFPKWALGYFQSKERYKSADELVEVASEYRRRKIPLDAVVMDWQSWPEGLWGQKSLDPTRFPDPEAMTGMLHGMHTHLMFSIWPNMQGEGANRLEMMEKGFLLGNRSTYDAFDPAARAIYWRQAEEGLFRHGIDAWWCDCTEPFEDDWRGAVKPEPHERYAINTACAARYLDPAVSGMYSLHHSRGIWDGQRASGSTKRVINLTRSSYAGQRRYGAIPWSGDITATWDTLRRQIPEAMNFCAGGEPWWTLDVGAFFVTPRDPWFWRGDYPDGCDDLGYRELYTRWAQFGSMLPIFRSHGCDTPREIWRFGEAGEPFYDAIAASIALRYTLIPTLYSQMAAVRRDDANMLEALGVAFPDDPACYDVLDQYMFLQRLLVCPVTRPMLYGPGSTPLPATPMERTVRLPAGPGWYDFHTLTYLPGGQDIVAPAPLDRMPLYAKAGSILVLSPGGQYVDEDPNEVREIRIFAGADASFTLYDDAGDGYGYEAGEFAETVITWSEAERTVTLGTRKGSYPGMITGRSFDVTLVTPEGTFRSSLHYDGSAVKVTF